ncbi:MAG: hypothetical protein KatS3mg115_2506 [Candidatus Poribacteria bacterium]|nr:MAG: hypothetical protein KatS3mg115_2506 [Candidatus Poribacteria bacterium]
MNSLTLLLRIHRGIFFDLYGTLYLYQDEEAARLALERAMYERFVANGLQLPFEAFRSALSRFVSDEAPLALGSGATRFSRRIHRLARRLGLVLSPGQALEMADELAAIWQEWLSLDPITLPLLDRLRALDKRLALTTGFDHPPHVRRVLAEDGLNERFEAVLIADALDAERARRTLFELALERLGLRASETMYVGTAPTAINAARLTGLTPLQIVRDPKPIADRAFPEGTPLQIGSLEALLEAAEVLL